MTPNDDPLLGLPADPDRPVLLFEHGEHRLYWLGINEQTAFRCNTYLIVDGDQVILVDPGNRFLFPLVQELVQSVVGEQPVTGVIASHQDPDVAASLPLWVEINPETLVFASPRTQVLLPHFGLGEHRFHDIEAEPVYALPSGHTLSFHGAPFLHSPMAFATLDTASGFLFTSDVFAAVDSDWRLVVNDFANHASKMDFFHIDYMASHVAAQGFARKLEGLAIRAILPQHGSIIPGPYVADAINYLNELQCGLDILYPDIE